MGGQTVTMINRYPTGNAAGIAAALQDLSGFTPDYSTAGTALFQSDGASTATSCQVSYVQSAGSGAGPTVTATTSDCS